MIRFLYPALILWASKMRTFIDVPEWAIWILLVIALSMVAYAGSPLLRLWACVMLACQIAMGSAGIFGDTLTYSRTFYACGLIECLSLAIMSMHIGCKTLPARYRDIGFYLSPVCIAVPLFAVSIAHIRAVSSFALGITSITCLMSFAFVASCILVSAVVDDSKIDRVFLAWGTMLALSGLACFLPVIVPETMTAIPTAGKVIATRYLYSFAWMAGAACLAVAAVREKTMNALTFKGTI